MSELKPKVTPLKFKGQKPITQPKKRLYSELAAEDHQDKQASDKKEAANCESPKLKDSPRKKVKLGTEATNQLPIELKSDKTAAELSFDLVKKKRIMERIDDRMKLSHR